MGAEEAILYSYDIATISSIIPAFANAKDLIVCDEVGPGWRSVLDDEHLDLRCPAEHAGWGSMLLGGLRQPLPSFPSRTNAPQAVNYSIQTGCSLSRARLLTFKHNDLADLQRVLEKVAAEDKRSRCAECGGGWADVDKAGTYHELGNSKGGVERKCTILGRGSAETPCRGGGPHLARFPISTLVPTWRCCHRKPLNRRFIVVEGIYASLGDMAPLKELMALKEVCSWLGDFG